MANTSMGEYECTLAVAKTWAGAIITLAVVVAIAVVASQWQRTDAEVELTKACFAAKYSNCPTHLQP